MDRRDVDRLLPHGLAVGATTQPERVGRMTLAEHLIEVLEDAERHPEWSQFDARTLRLAAGFIAWLRLEGK
jgi:hypothetical protein